MPLSQYLSKPSLFAGASTLDDDEDTRFDNLYDLIDSAEAFLQSTASYSGPEVEAARARVVSQLQTAREHARKHRRAKAYRRATDMARTSGRYVSEHRWQSVTVAATVAALAAGLVIAFRNGGGSGHHHR